MRKILFAILAIVLLIFTGYIIYAGTNIGKFEIWGIKQISAENDLIDGKNMELANLVDNGYPNALKQLNTAGEKMQEEKKKYEEEASLASNSKYYMQSEKYKLEFLWTKIGNYAKDNNVNPKMQVSNGSANGIYNLNITAIGKYKNVASFIYDIENDARLGFKIENFNMVQASSGEEGKETNLVQGSFICKEIRIDLKTLDGEDNSSKQADSNNDSSNSDSIRANNASSNTNTTKANSNNTNNNTNTTSNENSSNINTTNNTTNADVNTNSSNVNNEAVANTSNTTP